MNNLPINWENKVDSPELVAWLQQFGLGRYINAAQINQLRDAINELHARTADTRIVENTGIEIVGTDVIINELWKWLITSVLYSNNSIITIPITLSSAGNQKLCYLCANQDNGFELVYGPESETNPSAPTIENNLLPVTFFLVTDGSVGTPAEPIVGDVYKKKSESLGYGDPSLTGENAVIQLRPEGNSRYAFSNPGLVSIDGFGLSLISGNPNAEAPYDGKDLFIENTGTTPFTLKHDGAGSANIKFFFIDETDLIIPPGGKVWLKYGFPYCEVIFKSWVSDVPSLQQVSDIGSKSLNSLTIYSPGNFFMELLPYGVYVENQLEGKNASIVSDAMQFGDEHFATNIKFKSREQNTDFFFEDEGGNKSIATREWVENNNFAYRDELFEYINKLHFRKFVYDFLEPVGSIRLQLPQQESFLVINSNIDKIKGFYIEEFESYNGKDYYIFNNTSQDVKLVNLDQNAEFNFNFKRGSDIIVPRKGIIHIKFIDGQFIDVIQSWIDFHELQSLNINNTNGGEVLTYNSSTQLWENKKVYNDLQIRRNGITISDDMIATTPSDNFQKLTFNSGGWSVSSLSNENNPGVIAITSSVASANSGGSIMPSSSVLPRNYAVGVGMQFDLIMRTSALSANVIMRFGIIAGTTNATQPSNGVYFQLNNNDLVGQTASVSVRSQTSAYTNITEATWYHFRVKMVSESLSVYELYNMNGTLLWTDSLTTNLPTIGEGVQPTFIAYNQIAEARQMCQVDYMSFTYPPMNRGALI